MTDPPPSYWRCMLVGIAAGRATFCFLLAALVVMMPMRAKAETAQQAWIHSNRASCCPHDNCHPVGTVYALPWGYEVEGLSGVIPHWRVHHWPFRETYACHYRTDATRRILCLFKPAPEGS